MRIGVERRVLEYYFLVDVPDPVLNLSVVGVDGGCLGDGGCGEVLNGCFHAGSHLSESLDML